MIVKICGLRTLPAATAVVEAGADLLGFNFVPSSRRCISPETARDIIGALPAHAQTVGIFVNPTLAELQETVECSGLNWVQLSGTETPEFCAAVVAAGHQDRAAVGAATSGRGAPRRLRRRLAPGGRRRARLVGRQWGGERLGRRRGGWHGGAGCCWPAVSMPATWRRPSARCGRRAWMSQAGSRRMGARTRRRSGPLSPQRERRGDGPHPPPPSPSRSDREGE